MKIKMNPAIKVTSEERHIADRFCEICENFDEAISECYTESDDVCEMMEQEICLQWDYFMEAVKRFASFIASCEED